MQENSVAGGENSYGENCFSVKVQRLMFKVFILPNINPQQFLNFVFLTIFKGLIAPLKSKLNK